VLLHVIAESGAWEKQGLEVDYDRYISRPTPTARSRRRGRVRGRHHVSTYGHRAPATVGLSRPTVNQVNITVVRENSGINGVPTCSPQVRDPRLASEPQRLALSQQHGLDADREDIESSGRPSQANSMERERRAEGKGAATWHWVRDNIVDACFLAPRQPVRQGGRPQGDRYRAAAISSHHVSSSLGFGRAPTSSTASSRVMIEGITSSDQAGRDHQDHPGARHKPAR